MTFLSRLILPIILQGFKLFNSFFELDPVATATMRIPAARAHSNINGHVPDIQNLCSINSPDAWQWSIIYPGTVWDDRHHPRKAHHQKVPIPPRPLK